MASYIQDSSGYGGYNYNYNPQAQYQQFQNCYTSSAATITWPQTQYFAGISNEQPVSAPTECSEFAWLRKRVEEILWK